MDNAILNKLMNLLISLARDVVVPPLVTALVWTNSAREPRKRLLGRGRSPRHNKRFRGSEGHFSELVLTREVTIWLSPYGIYPFESFGRQLQQLLRERGLPPVRANSTLR